MNILLIIPENVGTIASVSYDLYKGLCKQPNVDVYVACLGKYSLTGYQFDNVFKLGEKHGLVLKIISRIFKLRRIKKEKNIEIAISTLLGASYWNVLSGIGEYKIGVFHTQLAQMKYGGILFYYANYIANKLLCSRLSKMIAVNRSAYLDLKRIHRNGKCSIELVYNIHDFHKIRRLSVEPLDSEREKKIFETPVILYVGNLYRCIKGSDRLIKAFAKIKSDYPGCKLVFIGADKDGTLDVLTGICNEKKVSEDVYFLGSKTNPYKYMKQAKILVSPSRDEGLPGVLIEAISLGLKCVATNSSMGVWEIMQCIDHYVPQLDENVITDFGVICPNDLANEEFTINQLALAIETGMSMNFDKMKTFNISRFCSEEIIPYYLNKK